GPDEPSDQLTRHVLEARLGPAGPVEGFAGPVGGGLQTAQRLVHLRVRDLRQVPLPGDVEQFGPAVLTGEVGEVEVACDDGVLDVVDGIGDVICQVHDLSFDASQSVV